MFDNRSVGETGRSETLQTQAELIAPEGWQRRERVRGGGVT